MHIITNQTEDFYCTGCGELIAINEDYEYISHGGFDLCKNCQKVVD